MGHEITLTLPLGLRFLCWPALCICVLPPRNDVECGGLISATASPHERMLRSMTALIHFRSHSSGLVVFFLGENAIMPLKQSAGDSIPLNICNDRSQLLVDWHLSVSEQHAVAEYSLELHKSPHPYDRIGPLASDARERKSLLGNGSHGQITFSMFDGQ
ncbi:hypothetical protein B296_00030898 [Ensete ventricosum]|uniref:FHA domain-containing protein n=1 Tax=Ensete ventricosum TaxID=4639 RepID=A0A426YWP0_ENSVE|nr:hypothetical protein B296_00030898 [Ensete ventricosum]